MDPFVVVMIVVVGGLLVFLVLLGLLVPGSGAAQVHWRPTRSPEVDAQNEIDDLAQMQAAVNAKRRARGAGELTEQQVREQVSRDLRERITLRDDALVEEDIAQMLAAKNARRRAKGLPEITREEYVRDRIAGGRRVRALVVGGGCRGLDLTRSLVADGHAVRAVTRTETGRAAIEAAGGQCWIGTPDVIGTLRYALDNVTLLFWLLGTASGPPDGVAALHGSRLRMMLEKTTDTTVRGVVYEAAGSVPREVLDAGVAEMRHAQSTNEIPFALRHRRSRRGSRRVAGRRAARRRRPARRPAAHRGRLSVPAPGRRCRALPCAVVPGVLEIVRADLLEQDDLEAIVNAANSQLAHGGGIARAIALAGGPELEEESVEHPPVAVGDAGITTAGRLPFRAVIHAVGPMWRGGGQGEAELLASAHREALAIAVRNGLHRIGFPAISCGIFGYPVEEAAPVAVGAVRETMDELSSIELVRFCLLDDEHLAAFRRAAGEPPVAAT